MAAALQFLQEYGLTDYDELAAKTDAAVDQEHALAGELRAVQEELTHTAALMGLSLIHISVLWDKVSPTAANTEGGQPWRSIKAM